MHKQISATIVLLLSAIVLTLSSGQSFAQTNSNTNVGVQQNCTTKIMCCIPGKGCFSPDTPTGYTCNDGRAEPVTTCTKPTQAAPKH